MRIDSPPPSVPYCSLYSTVDQTIPDTSSFLSFNAERAKTDAGMHSTTASATPLTGTVAKTSGTNALTGTGTSFTTELTVGDKITVGTEVAVVTGISSNTAATAAPVASLPNWASSGSGITATRDDTSRLVCTRAGLYIVTAAAWINATSGSCQCAIITGSGTSTGGLGDSSGPGLNFGSARLGLTSPPTRLAVGDILRLSAFQNQTPNTTKTVPGSGNSGGRSPLFSFYKISD